MKLADQLVTMREAAALSQTELAEAAEVGLSTIQRLESGQALNPTIGTIRALAKACGHKVVIRFKELAVARIEREDSR